MNRILKSVSLGLMLAGSLRARHDREHGLSTAGYVSGYPGSPLAGLDSLLRAERDMLARNHVHFEPGLRQQ